MRARLIAWLDRLRDGFWLLPGAMAAAAVLLGVIMPWIDGRFPELRDRHPALDTVLFDAGGGGARAVLGAIAASSITVAATVFSITIAILALTSQQYGPRLLRTFTRHRGVQFALGTFIASFLYPLIVLRTVRDAQETFVPHLSVTLALLLAVTATGVLIYFIDLLGRMIRAPQIISMVEHDFHHVSDEQIPADGRRGDSDEEWERITGPGLPGPDDPPVLVAPRAGYVTVISMTTLLQEAAKAGHAYRVVVMPGDYVHAGMPLLHAAPEVSLSSELREGLEGAFRIGDERTTAQDLSFCINQLVEVALRAMSPSLNDPFTALNCVHALTAGLARLVQRPFPDPRHRDDQGRVRLVARRPTFAYLIGHAYAPLRRYARRDARLLGELLASLAQLMRHCPDRFPARRQAIAAEAEAVFTSMDGEMVEQDRRMLEKAYEQFRMVADTAAGTWVQQDD